MQQTADADVAERQANAMREWQMAGWHAVAPKVLQQLHIEELGKECFKMKYTRIMLTERLVDICTEAYDCEACILRKANVCRSMDIMGLRKEREARESYKEEYE